MGVMKAPGGSQDMTILYPAKKVDMAHDVAVYQNKHQAVELSVNDGVQIVYITSGQEPETGLWS